MSPNNHSVAFEQNKGSGKNSNKIIPYTPMKEKRFELRNSLLTDLFESNLHIRTVYHMFIVTLIYLFVNTAVHDYLKTGRIQSGFHLLYLGFGKFHIPAASWLGFLASTCLCYMCFIVWARVRIRFFPKSNTIKVWDSLWLVSLVGYYIFSFRIVSFIVTTFQLPPASAAFILFEKIRFVMKIHAFVRSNAPNILNYKLHDDRQLNLPKFSRFFYFLFAPTLIYREKYPRSGTIRWNFVMYRILEIAGVIFYYCFLLNRFLLPFYQEFGNKKYRWSEIIVSIFENSIIGTVVVLSTFFLVLHSVQNLFAELLYFGDRLFYKDWWTCTSFSEYFRTWNIVVHDWLYTYVYKDTYEVVLPRNKTAAKFMVFILSAVVHEWVLTNMFGFFFPALFSMFFFVGGFLSFITVPKITILNILFWYGFVFGSGSLFGLYTLEYYARHNAPTNYSSLKDYLLPRFLICDCIE